MEINVRMDFSFQKFSCRNEKLPMDFRLKADFFQMTSFTFDDIQKETDTRLSVVRKETEKATRSSVEILEKIKGRFSEEVTPRLVVKSIRWSSLFPCVLATAVFF